MTAGASGIASDVLTVVIGALTLLLLIYGLHILVKIMVSSPDKEDEKQEDEKYHV